MSFDKHLDTFSCPKVSQKLELSWSTNGPLFWPALDLAQFCAVSGFCPFDHPDDLLSFSGWSLQEIIYSGACSKRQPKPAPGPVFGWTGQFTVGLIYEVSNHGLHFLDPLSVSPILLAGCLTIWWMVPIKKKKMRPLKYIKCTLWQEKKTTRSLKSERHIIYVMLHNYYQPPQKKFLPSSSSP